MSFVWSVGLDEKSLTFSDPPSIIIGDPRHTEKCHKLRDKAIKQPIMQLITEMYNKIV